jgi:ATP-dependent DNA ligase
MSISFFYPPQPTRLWPNSPLLDSLAQTGNWDAEIKYNGWRALIFKTQAEQLFIYNRHSTIIDIDWKQFLPLFKTIPINTVFDGELLDRRTKDLKNILVLWDTPFYNGRDLRNIKLKDRRAFLEHFGIAPLKFDRSKGAQVFRTQQFTSNFAALYHTIVGRNEPAEEGIVIKKLSSLYKSHPTRKTETIDWFKIRKIGDHALVSKDD